MAPRVSVCIPHVPIDPSFDVMLEKCIGSLTGYDELVVVVNDGIGYAAAFNRCFKYAKGDYILGISNDTILTDGELSMLCIPNTVTYSENAQWGCFFGLPRTVYDAIGGFDESFGLAYWEDVDFIKRVKQADIPVVRVPGVKVFHEGGATVKALGKETEAQNFAREQYIKKWGQLDENTA